MKGLLKFITCGSVDDGKSTLIGHILYDAKLLYADQERALELDSRVGSREGAIDYSLLLDGLMAEREQGITIDVAYRYFTTDNRSFIVADTPGHEQYTRNMAGYSEQRFREISAQIQELSEELSLDSVRIIPVSATEGDNITVKSENMPWYENEPLLEYLENIDTSERTAETGAYLPVQRVCRPNHEYRARLKRANFVPETKSKRCRAASGHISNRFLSGTKKPGVL